MVWVLLKVNSRRGAEVALEVGGYRPVMKRLTKPQRKKQSVVSSVPIFPAWVFLQYEDEKYRSALEHPWVHGVVKYGRLGVMVLRDEDIERVREIEAEMGEFDPIEEGAGPVWRLGDQVWVPVIDKAGIVVGVGGDRVKVEIEGFDMPVDVVSAQLRDRDSAYD